MTIFNCDVKLPEGTVYSYFAWGSHVINVGSANLPFQCREEWWLNGHSQLMDDDLGVMQLVEKQTSTFSTVQTTNPGACKSKYVPRARISHLSLIAFKNSKQLQFFLPQVLRIIYETSLPYV